ncbi:MAG: two-component system response regulator LytT [Saprospiraceae bacterium]|jgi:two-component system response regulator LytT
MKILIIEDEARIAKRIERMVRSIFGSEINSILMSDSLEKGQRIIAENKIDLLFLDLNLNGKDGFDILESVVSEPFHTIIISAYKDKAIRAFEYGVLDFVPKPFDEERLSKACQRITSKSNEESGLKFLAIKKKGKRSLINIKDIKYIKGAGIYTELFLKTGGKEVHNKTLENLTLLLPDSFERIHKSYLVEMTTTKQIIVEPGSKYSLELYDGDRLPIGRTRYKGINEKWFS